MAEKEIKTVKAKHEKKLMKISGVIGLGIGKEGDEDVIVVLASSATKNIPKKLEGYKVVVRETGAVKAL